MAAVFIVYEEATADAEAYYAGGGVYGVRAVNQRVETRRIRYSNTVNDEMKRRAADYIRENMGDRAYMLNLRVEVLED